MSASTSIRLRSALAFGAVLGFVVLFTAAFVISENSPWNTPYGSYAYSPDLMAYAHKRFWKSALTAGMIGGLAGTVIAAAVWATRSGDAIPRPLFVAAWWLLGAIGGLAAAVGVLLLPVMAPHINVGRDGSGGPGVGLLVLVVGIAGLGVGSISGIGIGMAASSLERSRR